MVCMRPFGSICLVRVSPIWFYLIVLFCLNLYLDIRQNNEIPHFGPTGAGGTTLAESDVRYQSIAAIRVPD